MIEFFGVFAIGVIIGILGSLLILRGLRRDFFDIDDDEEEFESLEEIFSHDEDFIPEEEEIKLPQNSELKIPTGDDKEVMEDLKNGNEEK